MMKDYFNDCMTLEALEQKHRKLVLQLHPDRNSDRADATREFQEMQAQYEERKAELNGDYSGSQRARQRRERAEREEREREERERRERESHIVDDVINEARRNKGFGYRFETFKAGAYVYARKLDQGAHGSYDWDSMSGNDLVRVFYTYAAEPEMVVKIESIVELDDKDIMDNILSDYLNGIYGGWEILQSANPNRGVKGKRVAKVVMFRSKHYCFFGNPMGDLHTIVDYYVPVNCAIMFGMILGDIAAEERRKKEEEQRLAAELRAKLEAEQESLIAAWSDKLIAISAALTDEEKETVAVSNLRKMLKSRFHGAAIRVTKSKVMSHAYQLVWEDGPMLDEVNETACLFETYNSAYGDIVTPWNERFGRISLFNAVRVMSTLAKASILEQLGEVSDVFTTAGYDDYVEVSDMDWTMINLMVGKMVEEGKGDRFCHTQNGKRMVVVRNVVEYIFDNTSYAQKPKAKKRKVA